VVYVNIRQKAKVLWIVIEQGNDHVQSMIGLFLLQRRLLYQIKPVNQVNVVCWSGELYGSCGDIFLKDQIRFVLVL
jgi:hypothetical protein